MLCAVRYLAFAVQCEKVRVVFVVFSDFAAFYFSLSLRWARLVLWL